MWAAAVSLSITKMAAMGWRITGSDDPTVQRLQSMLLESDGPRVGWSAFMAKTVRDYLTTDNGAFIEIIRDKPTADGEILGLRHLDSMRCTRTGDPGIPLIFTDNRGRLHEMKDYQVMMFSDMPDPGETYFGVGMCAASRSYRAIYKLATIEWYLAEKVGGLHPLAIYVVNGVLSKQLEDAVDVATQQRVARGLLGYMGAVIIGVPDETQPQVATIPLAELPDRFDRKQEFDISLLTYADNLGLDPQDLQPLTGQALGTGSQSLVLHDKARGKGLVSFRADFAHQLNSYVFPEYAKFEFVEHDWRDEQQKAALAMTKAQVAQTRIAAQITSAEQELQMLVDEDQLPKEILRQDMIDRVDLADDEKTEEIVIDSKLSSLAPQPAAQPGQPGQPGQPQPAGPMPVTDAEILAQLQADETAGAAEEDEETEDTEDGKKVKPPTARSLRRSDGLDKERVAKELRQTATPEERARARELLEKMLPQMEGDFTRIFLDDESED
jgi:hypothetical protein